MDFSLSEELEAAKELIARILGDKATHERLRALTLDGVTLDRETWKALGDAGLLGLCIDEADGGAGLGFLAAAVLAEETGRSAAPLPVISTIAMGALPLAAFGSPDQKAALLGPVIAGDTIVTSALTEIGSPSGETHSVTATPGDGGHTLAGTKISVTDGTLAERILVPARVTAGPHDGEVIVAVVDPTGPGVTVVENHTTTGRPEARLDLDGVAVGAADVLGDATNGAEIAASITRWAQLLVCLEVSGACGAALKLAASYTQERYQFDRPLATFQAVSQRTGDGYIDNEAVWLTAWQAAWRVSAGLDADREIAIARYWAAEGGHRVTNGATHLHGGVGVDRDYPLHRYFLLARHHGLVLGGPSQALEELGATLAG